MLKISFVLLVFLLLCFFDFISQFGGIVILSTVAFCFIPVLLLRLNDLIVGVEIDDD